MSRVAPALAAAAYRFATAVFGRDLGIGRSVRTLGPLTVRIAAPRETVFEVIAQPYKSERLPRALAGKLKVVERHGDGSVLAEHYTQSGLIVATTLETVDFRRPDRVGFRLVRGPVPHVVETFDLREVEDDTVLDYSGELGTDLWALGRLWGRSVAAGWEAAVSSSLEKIKQEAERQAR